jgi:uncharacterized protein
VREERDVDVPATQQSQAQPAGFRPLAIVTNASTGVGLELALCCARNGFDLVVSAEDPRIFDVAKVFGAEGAAVDPMQVSLDTVEDVDQLYALANGRPVDALLVNASRDFDGNPATAKFIDQDFTHIQRAIDANVTATLRLVHHAGRDMRVRRRGRILITGSNAGVMFLDAFAKMLAMELRALGVAVACLRPDAARRGFEAMLRATVSFPQVRRWSAS